MRVRFQTLQGVHEADARTWSEAQGILDQLQLACQRDYVAYDLPPLYASGVRYRPQATNPEWWPSSREIFGRGHDDCNGLAASRAAELVVRGVDPTARAMLRPVSRRLAHAAVQRGNGRWWEDPSAVLGMVSRPMELRWKFRRVAAGWEVEVSVPMIGGPLVIAATAPTGADALWAALQVVRDWLDKHGAFAELAGVTSGRLLAVAGVEHAIGPQLRAAAFERPSVGTLERMTDEDFETFVAGVRKQAADLRTRYGPIIGKVSEIAKSFDLDAPPDRVVAQFQAAVQTIGVAAGPIGVAVSAVVSAMMEIGKALAGRYPAEAIMVWQNAYQDCAASLGLGTAEQAARDGWVFGSFYDTISLFGGSALIPAGAAPTADAAEAPTGLTALVSGPLRGFTPDQAGILLCSPRMFRLASGRSEAQGSLADWEAGRARFEAIKARDGWRLTYVSPKNSSASVPAWAIRLSACPDDVLDLLATFAPLWASGKALYDAAKLEGYSTYPKDYFVLNLLRGMFGNSIPGGVYGASFNASGGGQMFTGLQPPVYLRVLDGLRPGLGIAEAGSGAPVRTPPTTTPQIAPRASTAIPRVQIPAPGPIARTLERASEEVSPASTPPAMPPQLAPVTAEKLVTMEQITQPGLLGDLVALHRLAQAGPNDPIAKLARALLATRR